MSKIVVVGTGFSGTVIARKIADEMNQAVTVLEKKDHVAGNMYDETDEHGILLHKYGPHVLVTNHWEVIDYLQQFGELYQHTVKEISVIDGKYIRLPFNFESVQQLIGYEKAEVLIGKLRKEFAGRDRVPVLELVDSIDSDISNFGNMLFDKSYRTYMAKQWDTPVEQLDKASILDRVPMAMNYDERYMNKDFQFLPKQGYTALFKTMLDHPNIDLHVGEDALETLMLDPKQHKIFYQGEEVSVLVFTGPVDELFDEKYGELPYRSLHIEYEWFDQDKVYPEKIVSFPQADGYTRKTEYKFMMYDQSGVEGSTVATEYPIAYAKGGENAPFYPVITAENQARYAKYCEEAAAYGNIFLCGRLAEFRYYNMDDCILHAFDVFEEIKKHMKEKGE